MPRFHMKRSEFWHLSLESLKIERLVTLSSGTGHFKVYPRTAPATVNRRHWPWSGWETLFCLSKTSFFNEDRCVPKAKQRFFPTKTMTRLDFIGFVALGLIFVGFEFCWFCWFPGPRSQLRSLSSPMPGRSRTTQNQQNQQKTINKQNKQKSSPDQQTNKNKAFQ